MITAAVLPWAALLLTLCLLLNAYRLLRGPALPDHVLALDTLYINTLALLIMLGIVWNTTLFFEAALVIALMGFIGTVMICKYLLRGDVIE
jgi:multicomponent K+:H+ antiporter subunit F